jgi:NAD(P)-dependent dehydrogenase (short-subunit alcohol dehydrogenase family)
VKAPLEGKAAIVTGASKGIGEVLAQGLAAAGAAVAVNYKSDADGAAETCRVIEQAGGKAIAVCADVSSPTEARRLVDETVGAFGSVDVLVNNAGRTRFGPPEEVTEDDWDYVMDTNLRGPFFLTVAAASEMKRRGSGSIVNVSSCAAGLMVRDHAVYTASKGGLEALTRQLALELAPQVRINAIAPAPTSIERNRQYDPNYDENWGRVIPMGRVAVPEDYIGPLVFLASEASGFLTGAVLNVDGGWTLKGHTPDMDQYSYETDRKRG